ncbi:hypothetical protein WDW89_04970 [Deltaproteobacteria bacterium TL4]
MKLSLKAMRYTLIVALSLLGPAMSFGQTSATTMSLSYSKSSDSSDAIVPGTYSTQSTGQAEGNSASLEYVYDFFEFSGSRSESNNISYSKTLDISTTPSSDYSISSNKEVYFSYDMTSTLILSFLVVELALEFNKEESQSDTTLPLYRETITSKETIDIPMRKGLGLIWKPLKMIVREGTQIRSFRYVQDGISLGDEQYEFLFKSYYFALEPEEVGFFLKLSFERETYPEVKGEQITLAAQSNDRLSAEMGYASDIKVALGTSIDQTRVEYKTLITVETSSQARSFTFGYHEWTFGLSEIIYKKTKDVYQLHSVTESTAYQVSLSYTKVE